MMFLFPRHVHVHIVYLCTFLITFVSSSLVGSFCIPGGSLLCSIFSLSCSSISSVDPSLFIPAEDEDNQGMLMVIETQVVASSFAMIE